MQGNGYPGQFPYQPGPNQPGGPNQPRLKTWLWLLIIAAIALIVGVSVFGIFYFGVFGNNGGIGGIGGGNPTPVPSTTGNSTPPPSGPCKINSPTASRPYMRIKRLLVIISNSMSVGYVINFIGIKLRLSQVSTIGALSMHRLQQ